MYNQLRLLGPERREQHDINTAPPMDRPVKCVSGVPGCCINSGRRPLK